ncbi:MAG: heme-binding protein [Pseudomonadota bacterium]
MKYVLIATVVLSILAFRAVAAYEEPVFAVLSEHDGYEIRQYEPYLIAEVDVSGDLKRAGNDAFKILAGYIFGDNDQSKKMNMTAPVTSVDTQTSVKMNMTAPVTATANGGERFIYAFVMERAYTQDTLPQPRDSRIRIRQVDGKTMAVRRYSGSWSEAKYRKNEQRLLEALSADGVTIIGEPVFARYNGPFTPGFLRRNEVLVEVPRTQTEVEASNM